MKAARFAKPCLGVLLGFGLFFGGVFMEEFLRSAYASTIPVDHSRVTGVRLKATRKPDFLWIGTAWHLDYESSVPFHLDLGSGRSARVPAGAHKIFWNHDHSNLDQYGLGSSNRVPQAILLTPANP